MKIKFNLDDNLPLNKQLKFHNMNITIRSIFEEDGKLYPQVFLDDTLCHDLMQKAMGFNNIAIVYVKDSAYRIFGI